LKKGILMSWLAQNAFFTLLIIIFFFILIVAGLWFISEILKGRKKGI